MARLSITVKPRARSDGVDVDAGAQVVVRVKAPPVDGKANEAVVEVVAAALGLKRRDVRIVAGEGGRQKILEIDLDDAELARRLGRA